MLCMYLFFLSAAIGEINKLGKSDKKKNAIYVNQSISQYINVHKKVDQRADQLSLPYMRNN